MSFGIREDYRSLYHPTLLLSEQFLFLPFTIIYGDLRTLKLCHISPMEQSSEELKLPKTSPYE